MNPADPPLIRTLWSLCLSVQLVAVGIWAKVVAGEKGRDR